MPEVPGGAKSMRERDSPPQGYVKGQKIIGRGASPKADTRTCIRPGAAWKHIEASARFPDCAYEI